MDVRLPDGTILRNVPEGTTKAQIMAKVGAQQAPQQPPEPEGPGMLSQLGRQIGLTARAPVAAGLAIPAMVGDLVTGGRSTPAVETVLNAIFPTPQGGVERFAQDVAGAAAAGGGLAAATKTMQTAMPQVLSAMGGAAGSAGAREADIGPVGQIIAGLGGGVALPSAGVAATEGVKAAGRAAKGLVEPFTEMGRRNIVSRTMQAQAQDPRAAAERLQQAQEFVPGSAPTTAEAAQDAGLSALQKAVRNQNPADFADRASSQNLARQTYLTKALGTKADVDAMIASRAAATNPMREEALSAANVGGVVGPALEREIANKTKSRVSALQNAGQMETASAQQQVLADAFTPVPGMPRVPGRLSPNAERVPEYAAGAADAKAIAAQRLAERRAVESQLQSLRDQGYMALETGELQSVIGRMKDAPGKRASDVVQKTLANVQEKIASLSDENGIIDARDLYTIRKEIGTTIKQYSGETANWDKKLTASLETSIKAYIDNAIIKAGGKGWKDYLAKYAADTATIESRQAAQEVAAKALNPSTERLSGPMFARGMANMGDDFPLNARDSDALSRVNMDLKRSMAPEAATRASGSDTLQNMVGANMLQRAGVGMGGPVGRMTSGLMGKLLGPMESQTQGLMSQAMLDPKLGAELLSMQIAKDPKMAEELLRRLLVIPGAGLMGSGIAQ